MKKFLPIIILVAVVVIGAGAYFYLGKGKGGVSLGGGAFEGNLKLAVEKGIPLKCEWKSDESNFGTYWVKGKRVYSEVTTAGKLGYMIMKDNCIWVWEGGSNQGFKSCFEEIDYEKYSQTETGVETEVTGEVETTQPEVQFKCLPTTIPDSKFEAPTDVNFLDQSQMMQFGIE